MGWKIGRLFRILGIPLLAFVGGLWFASINAAFLQVFTANTFWGFFIRISLSAAGAYMVYIGFFKQEQFFESSKDENLNIFVSPEVFKTLIHRVLDNFDTVELKQIKMRPSKLSGVRELVVDISTSDPFSISDVLSELYEKISNTIEQSLGDAMGVKVIVKVRSFEVNS